MERPPAREIGAGGDEDDEAVEWVHAIALDLRRADVVDDDMRGVDQRGLVPGPRQGDGPRAGVGRDPSAVHETGGPIRGFGDTNRSFARVAAEARRRRMPPRHSDSPQVAHRGR